MMTPAQCRMARAALMITVAELASAAGVAPNTVNRFETGQRNPIPATLSAIQRALEAAGIEFTDDGGVKPRGPADERKAS